MPAPPPVKEGLFSLILVLCMNLTFGIHRLHLSNGRTCTNLIQYMTNTNRHILPKGNLNAKTPWGVVVVWWSKAMIAEQRQWEQRQWEQRQWGMTRDHLQGSGEKAPPPSPTTLLNCLTHFLIVCVCVCMCMWMWMCMCVCVCSMCVHITGRLEE